MCEPKLLQCTLGITDPELETSRGMKASEQTRDRGVGFCQIRLGRAGMDEFSCDRRELRFARGCCEGGW